jgi:hypothetical protein
MLGILLCGVSTHRQAQARLACEEALQAWTNLWTLRADFPWGLVP